MSTGWFVTGAVAAALGVGLGAFGAHAMRDRLTADLMQVWQTAVLYHLVHAIALLAVAWAATRWNGGWVQFGGWALTFGIVVFSGSLYLLAATGHRWLGAITPIGGMAFLVGWLALAIGALRARL